MERFLAGWGLGCVAARSAPAPARSPVVTHVGAEVAASPARSPAHERVVASVNEGDATVKVSVDGAIEERALRLEPDNVS